MTKNGATAVFGYIDDFHPGQAWVQRVSPQPGYNAWVMQQTVQEYQ